MTVSNSIYNPISLEVGNLLKDVQTGKIGLPDLQRPFVWGNDKVRDLLDSMLRGYPIGYVMLWDSPSDDTGKKSAIGSNQKTYAVPKSLVIDGQQRLTALLSSLYGVPVRDKNFKERTVRIAYDPIARIFKNADASTEKDARFVPDVSETFGANHDNRLSAYRRAFIRRLNESNVKKASLSLMTMVRMPSRVDSTRCLALSATCYRHWRYPSLPTRRPSRISSCA